MNIFILSLNQKLCARYHCDKHVVKMILETTQLLYTCLRLTGYDCSTAPLTKTGKTGYKATHKNHPCSVWVRESTANYQWLCKLGLELCYEYTHRYSKVHSCQSHIEWLSQQTPDLPESELTEFARAINRELYPECQTMTPVRAYRRYYKLDKAKLLSYTNRERPSWL